MSDPSPPASENSQEQERTKVVVGPIDALKPFDSSAKADAILRSSDSVDFYILRAFLSFASPAFDGMFSLDQGDVQESKDMSKNGFPVIPLVEDSATLYDLLVLVYPYATRPFEGDYSETARVARKYAMDEAEKNYEICSQRMSCSKPNHSALSRLLDISAGKRRQKPQLGSLWPDVGRHLANVMSCVSISAADYIELWDWRSRCQTAAEEAVYNICRESRERVYSFDSEPSSTCLPLSASVKATIREAILERLRKEKCPRGTVLENGTIASIFNRLGSENISIFKDILDACDKIAANIDNAAFKVPFKQQERENVEYFGLNKLWHLS